MSRGHPFHFMMSIYYSVICSHTDLKSQNHTAFQTIYMFCEGGVITKWDPSRLDLNKIYNDLHNWFDK